MGVLSSGRFADLSHRRRLVAQPAPLCLTFEEALKRFGLVHHLHGPPPRRVQLRPQPRYSPARGRGIAGAARATVPARLPLESRQARLTLATRSPSRDSACPAPRPPPAARSALWRYAWSRNLG